jgi:hypothetical protein
MDPTYEYLWAAGYDLPPDDSYAKGGQPLAGALDSKLQFGTFTAATPPRRGKKAARAKRQKGK